VISFLFQACGSRSRPWTDHANRPATTEFNRFSTKSDHQVLTADRLASSHVGERNSLASYLAGDGGFPRHRSRRRFSGYQNSWRRRCADTPACFARKPIDDQRDIRTMKLIVCFGLPGALIAFMSFF
jgi:hypothetical protein